MQLQHFCKTSDETKTQKKSTMQCTTFAPEPQDSYGSYKLQQHFMLQIADD